MPLGAPRLFFNNRLRDLSKTEFSPLKKGGRLKIQRSVGLYVKYENSVVDRKHGE